MYFNDVSLFVSIFILFVYYYHDVTHWTQQIPIQPHRELNTKYAHILRKTVPGLTWIQIHLYCRQNIRAMIWQSCCIMLWFSQVVPGSFVFTKRSWQTVKEIDTCWHRPEEILLALYVYDSCNIRTEVMAMWRVSCVERKLNTTTATE